MKTLAEVVFNTSVYSGWAPEVVEGSTKDRVCVIPALALTCNGVGIKWGLFSLNLIRIFRCVCV